MKNANHVCDQALDVIKEADFRPYPTPSQEPIPVFGRREQLVIMLHIGQTPLPRCERLQLISDTD